MCYVPFVTRSRLINGPEMGVSRLTNGPASVVTQTGRPVCVFPSHLSHLCFSLSETQTGPAGWHTNGTVPFVNCDPDFFGVRDCSQLIKRDGPICA